MSDNVIPDHVDRLRAQWNDQRSDIDTTPMSVLGRINRIAILVGPSISSVMHDAGIDRGEFDVLASLRRSGKPFTLSPTELYTSLMLSSGGLSNRLQRLQSKGLIKRKSSNTDGRSQLVLLSKSGLLLTDKVFQRDMDVENMLLSGMNMKDLNTLATLLRKLHQSIDRLG